MGNQSDATDDIQDIADSLPDTIEEIPASTPPSVIDIEGKAVRLDRSGLGSQRPVQGVFTPRTEFQKISSQDKDKDTRTE